MKKLVSVVLMLCLALACAPAAAEPTNYGPYTLDLSKGDYTTAEGLETQCVCGSLNEIFFNELAAYDVPTGNFDLDNNGTWDVHLSFEMSSGGSDVKTITASELPTNSVSDSKTFDLKGERLEDYGIYCYYGPFKFQFPVTAVQVETTYSDASGVYRIEDGEAVFMKPAKTSVTNAKVPDTIMVKGESIPVTVIAASAFRGNQKKLTKVTIGKNVKEIGMNAFFKCTKLKTVSGGANVEIIGGCAFQGCTKLTRFTIGANVKEIGKKAFYKCAALKKITIKTKLLTAQSVGSSAFKGINKTATIKVPKAVKKEYTKWLLKKGVKKTMKIK